MFIYQLKINFLVLSKNEAEQQYVKKYAILIIFQSSTFTNETTQ